MRLALARAKLSAALTPLVDLATVRNIERENDKLIIFDLAEEPIVTEAAAPLLPLVPR